LYLLNPIEVLTDTKYPVSRWSVNCTHNQRISDIKSTSESEMYTLIAFIHVFKHEQVYLTVFTHCHQYEFSAYFDQITAVHQAGMTHLVTDNQQ